jgi:excisionase family DNA binding protein
VLLWHRHEKVPLCSYRPQEHGPLQIAWELPVYSRILGILKNPIYAGAFAYGRTRTRSQMVEGRARKSGGHTVPMQEWSVLIRDHHAGYITWDEYTSIQKQLTANMSKPGRAAKGAAKNGPALLAGLLRCARCGRKLHVGYGGTDGRVPRYQCRGGNINHGVKLCLSFGGLRADKAITGLVLDAVQPLGVEAALQAWETSRVQQGQKQDALQLALEKARYESDRARRQYDTVEPENRLVAAELEARWNAALEQVTEAEAKLKADLSRSRVLTEAQRQRLLELGRDLHALWDHTDAPIPLKKRILRTMIEEIVVEMDEEAGEISFRIHWAGGAHTALRVPKNRAGVHGRATDREVVELVREIAKVSSDATMASLLNRLGYDTGAGQAWTASRVRSLRDYQKIPCAGAATKRAHLTLTEAAEQLGVNVGVVRKLVQRQVLPAKQLVRGAPWIINRTDLQQSEVQCYIAAVHNNRRVPRHDPAQTVIPLL